MAQWHHQFIWCEVIIVEIHNGTVLSHEQVCGGDLLESFTTIKDDGEPLWLPEDQHIILAQNGVACLEREGVDLTEVIQKHKILKENARNSAEPPFFVPHSPLSLLITPTLRR